MQHREVLFFGQVQGVGFRYTARQIAGRFAVTGYVSNRHDGSVRVVVEGAEDQIEAFLKALNDEMARYIHSTEVHTAPATGEFTDFSIRY
jgi:acylphosphatase